MATFIYKADFYLTDYVNNLQEAQRYLTEDNMLTYLVDELKYQGREATANKLQRVEWILQSEINGRIEVEAAAELTTVERAIISEWIRGQCSDGLGEGFEQQRFACYGEEVEYSEDYEDEYCDEHWARFDWETNDYRLQLAGKEA